MNDRMPSISVVMPVYNAEQHLPRVLPPLLAALARQEIGEIITVDDGSTDDSLQVCRGAGCRALSSGGHLGPAASRNLGVSHARESVVLFVDADVVIHDDVPIRLGRIFEAEPDCVAVFGSYDDRPAGHTATSLYRNLLHHHVHQNGRREASTFWAGCGAVRRGTFLDVGGFDAVRFPAPSIEDIELGARLLASGGRIILDRGLQCTHLKVWTLRGMIETDVFRRAVPWGRLLLASQHTTNDLNISTAEKGKALLAAALVASVAMTPAAPNVAAPVILLLAASAWWVNRRLFSLVRLRGGNGAAAAAYALHQLYYLYGSASYAYCMLEHRLGRNPLDRTR